MAQQKIEEIPGWPVDDLYRRVYEINGHKDLRLISILAFVLGGLLLLAGALNLSSSSREATARAPALLFFGLAFVGGGIALVRQSKKPPKFVQVFRESPQRIVWLYITAVHIHGAYSGSRNDLNICLDDQTRVVLRLSSDDGELVLARLTSLVPQAALGYSVDYDTWFRRDPRKLLRLEEQKRARARTEKRKS